MPEPASERRTVAVVFARLAGVDAVRASLPPLEALDLFDAALGAMREAVESAGGTLDKIVGETLMAVFGAPVAHRDDGHRAVRACLRMRDAVAALARERSVTLAAACGANAGEVLWGSVAGERATAMGDVVNVAQRLSAAAAPGAVIAGESIAAEVRHAARLRALEPLVLKGRERPVSAFEVEEIHEGATARAPLAGREAPMAALLESLGRRGALMALEAGPGMGKSRLLGEFRLRARETRPEMRVLSGRALESARPPLGPLAGLVREAAGPRADASRIVASLASALERSMPESVQRENAASLIAVSIGLSVPNARIRDLPAARVATETRDAWRRWLEAQAPALVCLEDLHWADEDTLALLEELAVSLRGTDLLWVVTRRPEGRALRGEQLLPLGALDAPAIASIAQAAFGSAPDPALAEFLASGSGGNPFAVEELCRFLRTENLVGNSPARLLAAPSRVPIGLHALLVARLDALPAADKEIVKAASVVGREFWEGLLARLLARGVAEALEEARRREMIYARPASLLPGDRQLAFQHALLRDAAYSLVTKRERARLHHEAALLFESAAADAGRAALGIAAGHREAAGEAEEAARVLLAASRQALDGGAWAESLAAARESSRLGSSPEARLVAANALFRLARYPEALDECAHITDTASGVHRGASASIRASVLLGMGRNEEALAASAEAIALLPPGVDRLNSRCARILLMSRTGRSSEALAEIARTEEEFATGVAGESAAGVRADLQTATASCFLVLGRNAEALALLEESLRSRRARGDRFGAAGDLNVIGSILFQHGDFEGNLRVSLETVELKREVGDRAGLANALYVLAGAYYGRHRIEEAGAACEQSLVLAREIGDRMLEARSLIGIANIRLRQSFQEAKELYEEGIRRCREVGDRSILGYALNSVAQACLGAGHFDPARQYLEESLTLARQGGMQMNLAFALHRLGQLAIDTGDGAGAEEQLAEAEDLFRQLGNPLKTAEVSVARALSAAALGDRLRAIAMADEAIRVLEAGGWTWESVDALLAAAELRFPDSPAVAREYLERAASRSKASNFPRGRNFAPAMLAVCDVFEGRSIQAFVANDAAWNDLSRRDLARVGPTLARALAAAGQREQAVAVARRLERMFSRPGWPGHSRLVQDLLGELGVARDAEAGS
ncbi:MAG: tetratricopeptide repeat protein [Planctomycetota bacterium]|mgnify:CR=1 FL=1